jgi:hypothetical protein
MVDSSENAFGPFEKAFERGSLEVPGYLTLLQASDRTCRVVIGQIREAVAAPGAAEHLARFLRDPNWRPQLVAAVGILLSADRTIYAQGSGRR